MKHVYIDQLGDYIEAMKPAQRRAAFLEVANEFYNKSAYGYAPYCRGFTYHGLWKSYGQTGKEKMVHDALIIHAMRAFGGVTC